MTFPNGEVLTFTYDTAKLPGDTFNRTFYRPTRIASNFGFFISISYQPGALGTSGWNAPAVAALYNSSDPATPIQRLTYSASGTMITDLGGRAYTCTGCGNSLGNSIEVASGSETLPGEPTVARQVVQNPSYTLVGSVTRDGMELQLRERQVRRHNPGLLVRPGHCNRPEWLQRRL